MLDPPGTAALLTQLARYITPGRWHIFRACAGIAPKRRANCPPRFTLFPANATLADKSAAHKSSLDIMQFQESSRSTMLMRNILHWSAARALCLVAAMPSGIVLTIFLQIRAECLQCRSGGVPLFLSKLLNHIKPWCHLINEILSDRIAKILHANFELSS